MMATEIDIDGLRKHIGTKIVEEDEATRAPSSVSSRHSIETMRYLPRVKRFRPDGTSPISIHSRAGRRWARMACQLREASFPMCRSRDACTRGRV